MHPLLFVWRYNQDKKVAYFALKRDPGPIYEYILDGILQGGGEGGRWRLEGGYKRMCNRKIEDPALKS